MNMMKNFMYVCVFIWLLICPIIIFARCCGHGRGGGGRGHGRSHSGGGYHRYGAHKLPKTNPTPADSVIDGFSWVVCLYVFFGFLRGYRRWLLNLFKPAAKQCSAPFDPHYWTYNEAVEVFVITVLIIYWFEPVRITAIICWALALMISLFFIIQTYLYNEPDAHK